MSLLSASTFSWLGSANLKSVKATPNAAKLVCGSSQAKINRFPSTVEEVEETTPRQFWQVKCCRAKMDGRKGNSFRAFKCYWISFPSLLDKATCSPPGTPLRNRFHLLKSIWMHQTPTDTAVQGAMKSYKKKSIVQKCHIVSETHPHTLTWLQHKKKTFPALSPCQLLPCSAAIGSVVWESG